MINKCEMLKDGRVGLTLNGKAGGFYAWDHDDAKVVLVLLFDYFRELEEAKRVPPPIATSDDLDSA